MGFRTRLFARCRASLRGNAAPQARAAAARQNTLPRRFAGTVMNEPWLGKGRARVTEADIGCALTLYCVAAAWFAALLLLALAARHFL